jgi:hypothetical protein
MSFFDRLMGREPKTTPQAAGGARPRAAAPGAGSSPDELALERYRYMLRTAPPEDIERAHEEAFATLSADQRRMVLEGLAREVPPGEVPGSDDPASLARLATRAELRQPGTMERTFAPGASSGFGMPGLGSMFLYSLAGSFIGTAVAQSFFDNDTGFDQGYASGYDQGYQQGSDSDTGTAEYQEGGYAEGQGEDLGADAGFGGDTGGGDFGGGDFGGGDFGGGDF